MIPRYSRPEIAKIWTDEARFQWWLEIELLAIEALAELGRVPAGVSERARERARVDSRRIEELEQITHHDVAAFVSQIGEALGEDARYLHLGLTSSDLLDTTLAVQLREATTLIIRGVEGVLEVLKKRAREEKDTAMIGRTHGIHAEPITLGLKFASWYDEMRRARDRLLRARDLVSVGKVSGVVGTYGNLDPRVEEYVCGKLGLVPARVSTQVVPRDLHAEYFSLLAVIGGSIERIAGEIRGLQRTEVLELEEPFRKGQKGSSAMPHKRNPILSENLTGLSRLLRSYAQAALENIALWHERDISHSSVERVIGPDATILLDFSLTRLGRLIEGLVIYRERIQENLARLGGLIFSEAVMITLQEKGLTRDEAYSLVQRNAQSVWTEGGSFQQAVESDPGISRVLSREEISECFDLAHHLRFIDIIFRRVLGD